MNAQRYPLTWPTGWPRIDPRDRGRARFGRRTTAPGQTWQSLRAISVNDATMELLGELRKLGADEGPLVSTNIVLRLDGLPRSDQREPSDPGAAIYFELDKKTIVLACDKWDRVADNIYAIAKHVEALRGQERWGVGSVEQAFRGYTALGSGDDNDPWWHVLGVKAHDSTETVKSAHRAALLKAHPDQGGDPKLFVRVCRAWESFRAERGIEQ